jgi:hypothetical protein
MAVDLWGDRERWATLAERIPTDLAAERVFKRDARTDEQAKRPQKFPQTKPQTKRRF